MSVGFRKILKKIWNSMVHIVPWSTTLVMTQGQYCVHVKLAVSSGEMSVDCWSYFDPQSSN